MMNTDIHNDGSPIRNSIPRQTLSAAQMDGYCRQIVHYLETTKRYCTPGYSLWELSRETGISAKNISRSINGYLKCNFYDLLNRMRIEEAKTILHEMATTGSRAIIDAVGERCGFRSRSVFFSRFREYEKTTPAQYMNLYKNNSDL